MSSDFERLSAVLKYDADTGEFFWRTQRGNRFPPGMKAGTLQASGYVVIGYQRKYYKAHRLAWLFTYGDWPTRDLDHINRKTDDNRIANLRECSASQNQANRSSNKNNSTGHRGVTFHKRLGKFQAAIRVFRKPIHLGTFDTANEASQAYGEAAKAYFGEFGTAMLNRKPEKVG